MDLNFRDSSDIKDIIGLIKKSGTDNTIIWQNIESERKIYKIEDIELNEILKTVKITLANYKDDLLIDEIIYIKLSFRETLFKARVINLTGNVLSLYIPNEVKTLELREHPRIKFRPKDEKYISILISNLAQSLNQTLKVKVVDISESGISVLITDENKALLQKASHLSLTHLDQIELIIPKGLELRYLQRLRYRQGGRVVLSNRAGFKFDGNLAASDLTYFTRRIS